MTADDIDDQAARRLQELNLRILEAFAVPAPLDCERVTIVIERGKPPQLTIERPAALVELSKLTSGRPSSPPPDSSRGWEASMRRRPRPQLDAADLADRSALPPWDRTADELIEVWRRAPLPPADVELELLHRLDLGTLTETEVPMIPDKLLASMKSRHEGGQLQPYRQRRSAAK